MSTTGDYIMSEIRDILPSYLDKATPEEKKVFFQVLVCFSGIDGQTDEEEIEYNNERYSVIRALEPKNKFDIVLVASKKIGVK